MQLNDPPRRTSKLSIRFGAGTTLPNGRTCPICGSGKREALLEVLNTPFHGSDLHMARCLSCKSAYFMDAEPVIGYGHKGFVENYWFNYVQNGAGISAMLEPLLCIDRPRRGRLLDIGCGFGFVPHFWQDCGIGEAVGLGSGPIELALAA